LTKEIVALLHDNGLKVNCWTVDDAEKAEQLVEWGVDYITSNILE
jgi:glycerophosphoryl diester phosphodiesterase